MKRLVYVVRQETLDDRDSGFGRRVKLLLEILPGAMGKHWTCELLIPFACDRAAPPGWNLVSGDQKVAVPAAVYQVWRKRLAPVWRLASVKTPLDWSEFIASLLGIDPLQIRALRRGLERGRADVVLLSRCDLVSALPAGLGASVVVDTNDLLNNLLRVYRPREKLLGCLGMSTDALVARAAAFERTFYRSCTAVAIAAADEIWLRQNGCERVVSEAQCLLPVPRTATRREPRAKTVCVGYFGGAHAGSVASGRLFCKVAEAMIGDDRVRFEVAGTVCAHLAAGGGIPGNLTLRGRVDSMADFFSGLDAILLLSPGETGTSVKFQEALFSGVPVIANQEAARFEGAKAGLDYSLVGSIPEAVEMLSRRTWVWPDTSGFLGKYGREAISFRWHKIVEGAMA